MWKFPASSTFEKLPTFTAGEAPWTHPQLNNQTNAKKEKACSQELEGAESMS